MGQEGLYCINLEKDMNKWKGYCEHSNETVYSIKCGEFPHELRKCQLLTGFCDKHGLS